MHFSKSIFAALMMTNVVAATQPISASPASNISIHDDRALLAPSPRQARRRSTERRAPGATRRPARGNKLGRRLRRKHELGRAGAF